MEHAPTGESEAAILSGLHESLKKIAAEKSIEVTPEEIDIVARNLIRMAEEEKDPFTLDEVQNPPLEVRERYKKMLMKRADNPEVGGLVINDRDEVIGSATSREEVKKVVREDYEQRA